MSLPQKLIDAGYMARMATTAYSKHEALYTLRMLLAEHALDLVLTLDAELYAHESQLDEYARNGIRKLGYQFPEDFDDVPSLMEDNDYE